MIQLQGTATITLLFVFAVFITTTRLRLDGHSTGVIIEDHQSHNEVTRYSRCQDDRYILGRSAATQNK